MMRHRIMQALAVLGALVVAVVLGGSLLLLLNVSTPYQPFAVRGVHVVTQTPNATVCPGAPVEVQIDRKFTQDFDQLNLRETWVTVPAGRPVESADGTLPASQLRETRGFDLVDSPLLQTVPDQPGTYRVQVVARPTGTRYFGLRASGKATYYSTNTITVADCGDDPTIKEAP